MNIDDYGYGCWNNFMNDQKINLIKKLNKRYRQVDAFEKMYDKIGMIKTMF